MKSITKSKALACVLFFCIAGAFAQDVDTYEETTNVQEQKSEADNDNYDEVEPVEQKSDAKTTEKTQKKKKKEFGSSGNFFKDFIFGKQKYIFYDEVDLATGTLTFGIKPRVAQMIYNPKTDKVGVQVYFQTSYFNIVFGEKERKQIVHSISQYLDDFENKRLIRNKAAKTRKIYGKGNCFEEWGTAKGMMTNFADTRVTFGYEFKKDNIKAENASPYFCIIIKGAKNEQKDMGMYISQESTEVQLYFTRARAKAFAYQLSEERIGEQRSVYLKMMEEDHYDPEKNADSYTEGDSEIQEENSVLEATSAQAAVAAEQKKEEKEEDEAVAEQAAAQKNSDNAK